MNISKTALVGLVSSVFRPNPLDDSPSPIGPGGPVMHILWQMLNPQPIPPGEPQPIPWRHAFETQTFIARMLEHYQFAEVMGTLKERQKDVTKILDGNISSFVDEYCKTLPRPLPRHALELFVVAAEFQKAADRLSNHPLRTSFSNAADKLFEAGAKTFESSAAATAS